MSPCNDYPRLNIEYGLLKPKNFLPSPLTQLRVSHWNQCIRQILHHSNLGKSTAGQGIGSAGYFPLRLDQVFWKELVATD